MQRRIDVSKDFDRPTPPTEKPKVITVGGETFVHRGGKMLRTGFTIIPGTTIGTTQRGLFRRLPEQANVKAKLKQNPAGKDRPVSSWGILALTDKFFNWLNKIVER